MKKILALLFTLIMVFSLVACGSSESGGKGGNYAPKSALDLLENVWGKYAEDEKFPVAGGDFSEANNNMNGPGKFGLEDADMVDSTLGFPKAEIDKIDEAASLMHMMNANTFTCGAYHIKNSGDISALAESIKKNVKERQWMCGFPDKLIIMSGNEYIVCAFGNEEIINTFKQKLADVSGFTTVCDEAIE